MHDFLSFFRSLYNTTDLEHLSIAEETLNQKDVHNIDTELHKKFYTEIKTNDTFKRLYCDLIRAIYAEFFPEETVFIYQSFPSIRLQFKGNIAVPPHYDSDATGSHPLGEKNFILPITRMYGTNRLFLESSPGKKDFEGVDLDYGQLFFFNGNKCTHYNQTNVEDTIRISMDFRILLERDYRAYLNAGQIVSTNPRDPTKTRLPTKMLIGGYYQMAFKADSLEQMIQWTHQKEFLLQSQPNFDNAEAVACYEYMKDGTNFVTEYKKTEELERAICEYTGAKYCVMTTSGNMALVLALMALKIQPGDEVIVPNYTMIASINSIKFLGAIPVLVDVASDTLTMDLETVQAVVTPKTKVVMHVSLNNREKSLRDIAAFCSAEKIHLLEDAAQSLGCLVDGQHFGTFGTIGCFSLSTPKIISTGQGGFCITNDAELHRTMTMIKNFGRRTGGVDVFETFGINMKYTDIQAVIGIEQMKKLPGRVTRMREIYDLYYSSLKDVCTMIEPTSSTWIPWFVDIFTERRDALSDFLKLHNIQTRPTYPEIHKTPMYLSDASFPVSTYVSTNGLFLPSHTLLTDSQILFICKLIRFFFS